MLHSFFLSIPRDLDEAALVDGCTRFQAFRLVVVPVMWPGVITTGLFAFLLAYNDFAVTSMLLSQQNQTMVPKIASFLGSVQSEGNVMYAVALGGSRRRCRSSCWCCSSSARSSAA